MLEDQNFKIDTWHEDDELHDIAQSIYTFSGQWTEVLGATWPNVESMDVLVIEDIFLENSHRGAELGLVVADRTIAIFGRGCGLAVICPWPTELKDCDDEENAAEHAHSRLGEYAERIGFKAIEGTDLWAKSLEHFIERSSN